jgi:hypothetical protein
VGFLETKEKGNNNNASPFFFFFYPQEVRALGEQEGEKERKERIPLPKTYFQL